MGLPKTIPACDLVRFKFIVGLHSNFSSSIGLPARRKDICELSESPFTFFYKYLSSAGRSATLGNTLTVYSKRRCQSSFQRAIFVVFFPMSAPKSTNQHEDVFLEVLLPVTFFFQAANMMRPD